MSNHNSTHTFTVITIATLLGTAIAYDAVIRELNGSDMSIQQNVAFGGSDVSSGAPIMYYNPSSEVFSKSMGNDKALEISSLKMQVRYKSLFESFKKNNNGFPDSRKGLFLQMANTVCKLPFVDNVSSYNDEDESIDTVLYLSNGLKLSISQFIDEDIESPVVFSIHRDKELLVSDELPLNDIVDTILSLTDKESNGARV